MKRDHGVIQQLRNNSNTVNFDEHFRTCEPSDDNHRAGRQKTSLAKVFRPYGGYRTVIFGAGEIGIQLYDVVEISSRASQTLLQLGKNLFGLRRDVVNADHLVISADRSLSGHEYHIP
jgi:hypothetical protein